HLSRRHSAIARSRDASVYLAVLGLKGRPSDHAFGRIEPQSPLLAVRRGNLVQPRKVPAFVRLAIGAEMELKESLASRQVKPMQQGGTVAQQTHHLDADHPAALGRLYFGQSGSQQKWRWIDGQRHADTESRRG